MSAGQDEPVAAQPLGVRRVVAQLPLEQGVGQRGQAHRGARMAVADLLHRIRGQHPDGIDRAGIDVGPIGRMAGLGERGDILRSGHR